MSVTLEKGTVRADPKLVEPREIFLLMSQALWTRLLLSYLWHLGFILHYRLNLLLIKTPVTLSERQCDISMLFYQFKQDSMKKLTFSQSNYECQKCRNPSFNYCHLESEKMLEGLHLKHYQAQIYFKCNLPFQDGFISEMQ